MSYPTIFEALTKYDGHKGLEFVGQKMFEMYTQDGFPPDIFLDQISKKIRSLALDQKIYITTVFLRLFLEHRRKAGLDERRIDSIRRQNRLTLESLVKTGEIGVY